MSPLLCVSFLHYFRRRHPYPWKNFHVSHVWTGSLVHSSSPVPSRQWVPHSCPPMPAERGPLPCGGPSCSRFRADPSLGPASHLTRVPPCPPDDAELVALKQEPEAVGDFRHRSPSRSLSVPTRPRPPHPPQRPPPPSKTLLLSASTMPAGNNPLFPATQHLPLSHCCLSGSPAPSPPQAPFCVDPRDGCVSHSKLRDSCTQLFTFP